MLGFVSGPCCSGLESIRYTAPEGRGGATAGGVMPVLVSAEVPGQTAQGYDAIREHLAMALRQAPGFVLHTSHAIDGGWRVIEIWETKQEANQFFAQHVHPNLPPGIKPRRSFQELHGIVRL